MISGTIIAASITFFSTLFGGLIAAKLRHKLGVLAAFASGVLIGVALLDLLPEALKLSNQMNLPVENVMYITALGFITILILERYFSVHRICEGNVCKNIRHPKGGVFGAAELSLHSFIDGLAIGIGFQFNMHVGIIVSIAIISHDFSDGINTITVMLNAGNTLRSSMKMLLLDGITPVLGALSTLFFKIPAHYLVLLLPFFAGGFLYIGASDLLPEAHNKNPPLKALLLNIAGILLIFIIVKLLNG